MKKLWQIKFRGKTKVGRKIRQERRRAKQISCFKRAQRHLNSENPPPKEIVQSCTHMSANDKYAKARDRTPPRPLSSTEKAACVTAQLAENRVKKPVEEPPLSKEAPVKKSSSNTVYWKPQRGKIYPSWQEKARQKRGEQWFKDHQHLFAADTIVAA